MSDASDDPRIEALVADLLGLDRADQARVLSRLGAAPQPRPGWSSDGIFRVTREQLASPAFCYGEEWAAIQKSGKYEVIP